MDELFHHSHVCSDNTALKKNRNTSPTRKSDFISSWILQNTWWHKMFCVFLRNQILTFSKWAFLTSFWKTPLKNWLQLGKKKKKQRKERKKKNKKNVRNLKKELEFTGLGLWGLCWVGTRRNVFFHVHYNPLKYWESFSSDLTLPYFAHSWFDYWAK